MKCIITPVAQASVEILNTQDLRSIKKGLLIYVGIGLEDIERVKHPDFLEKAVLKIIHSKLFHTEQTDKIDASVLDIGGEILCISNFTLYGNHKKGTKIDFGEGARFAQAEPIYKEILALFQKNNISLKTGEFGALMNIKSENVGPLNYIFEF